MSDEQFEELPEYYTLKVGGDAIEIFMSYGLLDELTKLAPDPDRLTMAQIDPRMRSQILDALLVERDDNGVALQDRFVVKRNKLSAKAVEGLLGWSMEHVMDFFLNTVLRIVRTGEKKKIQTDRLAFLLSGSKD